MRRRLLFVFGALIAVILLVSGCSTKDSNDTVQEKISIIDNGHKTLTTPETAMQNCINLCKDEKNRGMNLESGPCLSDNITPDWVCDVAHSPRIFVDNLPENQCGAFRDETAHHFVEVDANCKAITIN